MFDDTYDDPSLFCFLNEKYIDNESLKLSTEDTDVEEQRNNDESIEQNKKKIKAEKRRFKTLTHSIIKFGNDVRKEYGIMWKNVYNSCDFSLMNSFLEKYYSPDFSFFARKKLPSGEIKTTEAIYGLSNIGSFWFNRMTLAPDLVCNLHNSVIKIRSDGTSAVSSNIQISGTMILKRENESTVDKIVNYNLSYDFVSFSMDGIITMHLDTDCRIFFMEMYIIEDNCFQAKLPIPGNQT